MSRETGLAVHTLKPLKSNISLGIKQTTLTGADGYFPGGTERVPSHSKA